MGTTNWYWIFYLFGYLICKKQHFFNIYMPMAKYFAQNNKFYQHRKTTTYISPVYYVSDEANIGTIPRNIQSVILEIVFSDISLYS